MSGPTRVLAVLDAERPLMAVASVLGGLNGLPAHDAVRSAVEELLSALSAVVDREAVFSDGKTLLPMTTRELDRIRAAFRNAGGPP